MPVSDMVPPWFRTLMACRARACFRVSSHAIDRWRKRVQLPTVKLSNQYVTDDNKHETWGPELQGRCLKVGLTRSDPLLEPGWIDIGSVFRAVDYTFYQANGALDQREEIAEIISVSLSDGQVVW
jgi:hypothetical protein